MYDMPCALVLSCVQLFVTPWTAACQAHLSMEFSRQEYWSGLLFLTPGYLPHPRIEPTFLASSVLAGDSLPLCYLGKWLKMKAHNGGHRDLSLTRVRVSRSCLRIFDI